MADPRVTKLAQVLVRYSLGVKKGEWVQIDGPDIARDLLRAALGEVLAAGGHPTLNVRIHGARHLFLKRASNGQIKFVSPTDRTVFTKADKILFVRGDWNTKELTGVDPKKISATQKSMEKISRVLHDRTAKGLASWCLTQFPTQASAQDAEMALVDYEDFVYGAGMLAKPDPVAAWEEVSRRQARLAKFLGTLKTVRIVGADTDLAFRVEGRPWVNCDGQLNFPDGEIFTSPIENSAEGHIRYTFPAVYAGREITNVGLTFKKGVVVKASADKGDDLLQAVLSTDSGARRVGELSFGTNYSITRFTKNTLFDEKIGGTMHIAVGDSLRESHGKNRSAIHWDMVCDTRKGFTIYGDGKPIQRNGKFLVP